MKKGTSSITSKICKIIRYSLPKIGIRIDRQDVETNALQEGMLIFIVNFVKDRRDEAEMARSFKALDLNSDGVVSLEELQIGLATYLGVEKERAKGLAKQIFKKVDLNNSGAIDFSGNTSLSQSS